MLTYRSIIPGGWGDYAHILEHGMTAHLPREDGQLSLERTGPYLAPITFPGLGDIVLSDGARSELAASGLSGFGFLPVAKKLIVELRWEEWDLSAPEPAELPEGGEPEEYIVARPHDPAIAAVLGDLWELVVERTATVIRPERKIRDPWPDFYRRCSVESATWNGDDIFRGKNFGSILLTQRARDWFLAHLGNYVDFYELQCD
jgi:hypothetical protein